MFCGKRRPTIFINIYIFSFFDSPALVMSGFHSYFLLKTQNVDSLSFLVQSVV